MTRLDKPTLLMTALCLLAPLLASPLAASDFVVIAAIGVIEPAGVAPGQELAAGAVLRLEPWGRVVVREAAGCGLIHVVAGASEHPLAPAEECSAVAATMEVAAMLQQGAAFAALLAKDDEAEGLAQMIANEPCVFLARVSDEGSNARHCPSGFALRALRCSGEYCDSKDLLCCPYLGGDPDPAAKETALRVISEEFPNVTQSKHFLNGLACDGPYCDNILPYQLKSPSLINEKECEWSARSSDVPGQWLDCGDGKLISGLRCLEDYCGNIAVSCCRATVK